MKLKISNLKVGTKVRLNRKEVLLKNHHNICKDVLKESARKIFTIRNIYRSYVQFEGMTWNWSTDQFSLAKNRWL